MLERVREGRRGPGSVGWGQGGLERTRDSLRGPGRIEKSQRVF